MPGLGVGVGVGGGLLPALLFGGVIGAGLGSVILYAGAIEEGIAEDTEGIFKGEIEPSTKAHSPAEPQAANIKAASVMELRRPTLRGFAASHAL